MHQSENVWHRKVIDAETERALESLRSLDILDRFYLAGGTGLALRLGHRRSDDLDFFSAAPVDTEWLIRKMKTLSGFAVAAVAPDTLHATLTRTKVSFLAYPYPVLFRCATFHGVNVADPRDVACMKLAAIASRGSRRDFIDLYFVAKQHSVLQVLEWFQQKYAQVNYSLTHILKSLNYFEIADKHPMPNMLSPLSWEEVKQFFSGEASRLVS
jgi:predicted nucleotidyltransferase component of viral defense system